MVIVSTMERMDRELDGHKNRMKSDELIESSAGTLRPHSDLNAKQDQILDEGKGEVSQSQCWRGRRGEERTGGETCSA